MNVVYHVDAELLIGFKQYQCAAQTLADIANYAPACTWVVVKTVRLT